LLRSIDTASGHAERIAMRIVLLFIALFAAACGGSAEATPARTPQATVARIAPGDAVFDPTLPKKVVPDPNATSDAVQEMRDRANGRLMAQP
jgi:hypothetical protein